MFQSKKISREVPAGVTRAVLLLSVYSPRDIIIISAYSFHLTMPYAIVLCEAETTGFLSWPNTPADTTESLRCPGSTIIISRTCNSSGVWESVDLSICTNFSSINIVSVSACAWTLS